MILHVLHVKIPTMHSIFKAKDSADNTSQLGLAPVVVSASFISHYHYQASHQRLHNDCENMSCFSHPCPVHAVSGAVSTSWSRGPCSVLATCHLSYLIHLILDLATGTIVIKSQDSKSTVCCVTGMTLLGC